MTKRVISVSGKQFAVFCIMVLKESEERDELHEYDELMELAMYIAKGDEKMAEALPVRFYGFLEMSEHPMAKQYLSEGSEKLLFHPAFFDAAAEIRTRQNGRFPERPFFKRVRELAESKYADFQFSASQGH